MMKKQLKPIAMVLVACLLGGLVTAVPRAEAKNKAARNRNTILGIAAIGAGAAALINGHNKHVKKANAAKQAEEEAAARQAEEEAAAQQAEQEAAANK